MKIYKFGLEKLKLCNDLSDIAHLLDVKPKFLSYQIYWAPKLQKYTAFKIPKKNGSHREIHAPNKRLKFIQLRLSRLLYQCYFDLHGKPKNPSTVLSHGFQKNRGLSIYTNAKRHTSRRYVFNADIADFFPSFNFGRVRGYFIKNKNFGLSDKASTVIAQIACFEDTLPQGAPCSPIISEFISQALDFRLQAIARRHRCTYSRYADDITFSTNMKEFPPKIGFRSSDPKVWQVGPDLEKAVVKSGFSLNLSKVRMQLANQRQATTGLTVNEKVNIDKRYYKGVRWCAHAMMTKGEAVAPKTSTLPGKFLSPYQIWGMLTHVHDIKGRENQHKPLRKYDNKNPAPHYLKLMGQFYHYRRIHINPKPVVICEGKTDYIYLKEAIRWNADDKNVKKYLVDRNLLKSPKGNGDHWHVDFLKHSKTADNLLGLYGGLDSLRQFVVPHLKHVQLFHSLPAEKPVIIIVDNDSQSKGMWSQIKAITESTSLIDGSEPFYHVDANLYVVPIPSSGKWEEFYIEKLFPQKWLNVKLDQKKLKFCQKKGEKLKPDEYGKMDFATKVIRKNRGQVNCDNFLPLLNTLCDIIKKY